MCVMEERCTCKSVFWSSFGFLYSLDVECRVLSVEYLPVVFGTDCGVISRRENFVCLV